jgi:ubiquinol-cytochrome c reductase cytochrome c subunit
MVNVRHPDARASGHEPSNRPSAAPPGQPVGRRSSRPEALGGVVALALMAIAAWLLAPRLAVGQSPTIASPGTVTQASAGEALYLHSCASCHGTQGAGTLYGPDIQSAGASLTDFVLRTGRMPLAAPGQQMQRGAPQFDEQQIEALVAYVAGFGGGPPIPSVISEGADVANGRSIYVANCAACHGPAGGGGAVGGGFIAPGLEQADPRTVAEAVVSGPGPMPLFSFGPDQLRDLTAYVQNLQNAPHPGGATAPSVGPVTEGFVAAIGLIGLLVVARFVGVRQRKSGEETPGR